MDNLFGCIKVGEIFPCKQGKGWEKGFEELFKSCFIEKCRYVLLSYQDVVI